MQLFEKLNVLIAASATIQLRNQENLNAKNHTIWWLVSPTKNSKPIMNENLIHYTEAPFIALLFDVLSLFMEDACLKRIMNYNNTKCLC